MAIKRKKEGRMKTGKEGKEGERKEGRREGKSRP